MWQGVSRFELDRRYPHMSGHLSVCLLVDCRFSYLLVSQSFYLPDFLSLSLSLFAYLIFCLSICLLACVSLSISLSACLSVRLCVCLCISVQLPTSLTCKCQTSVLVTFCDKCCTPCYDTKLIMTVKSFVVLVSYSQNFIFS